MKERIKMAGLFPLLAVLVIVIFGGGLGVTFMVLESTGVGEWGVIGLGLALVIGVPAAAALLQQRVERE